MVLDTNDSFIETSIKEIDKTDPFYDTLQKVADHLQLTLKNPGAASGISVIRDNFTDTFVGPYAIKESGSGETQGLFKDVEGILVQVTLPLLGEIKIIKGSGIGPFKAPPGWQIVQDIQIQSRYNVGTAPNWKAAAVEYIGI